MNQYILLFRGGHETYSKFTQKDIKLDQLNWGKWIELLASKNHNPSGLALSREFVRVVEQDKIINLPFGNDETKVSGYLIISAQNIEEVVEVSKICPIVLIGGNVEIKQMLPTEF